ncbi:hypothetical protein EDB19DRAFT_815103 [Suillus lakei]|nr:hypothetical protein EDB19DRAFT_815103 [Suillus lakei]
MDHDIDDDTLRDLEAGLYPRRHTRDASNSDSWLSNMKNSFTRPALGILQNRVSSHQHGVPGYAEDVDDDMHANDEDPTGMKIMFQMDSRSTNFVIHTAYSGQPGVSCVSPRNTTLLNHFCSGSPTASSPSAASSNTPPLTPDSSVGNLHFTSPEIASSQSSFSFSSHISREIPTPPLELEHVADRRSINEGEMTERPRCFDGLIADIDSPQDTQPPWLDDEFEEWYWLDYALKLSCDDRCSSEREHRSAVPSNSRESSVTLYTCGVFPPFHTNEDEEHYRWKRKHRSRDRKEAHQGRQAMSGLHPKSDDLAWIDEDEVSTW